jgi:hypothetical protein
MSLIRTALNAFRWFFGTLLGVPSVIDQPLPKRKRPRQGDDRDSSAEKD